MSRTTIYRDSKLEVIQGNDCIIGTFYQLFDRDMAYETPEGEGLVFDWSQYFGTETNYTGTPKTDSSEEDAKRIICKYLMEFGDEEYRMSAEQFNVLLFSDKTIN